MPRQKRGPSRPQLRPCTSGRLRLWSSGRVSACVGDPGAFGLRSAKTGPMAFRTRGTRPRPFDTTPPRPGPGPGTEEPFCRGIIVNRTLRPHPPAVLPGAHGLLTRGKNDLGSPGSGIWIHGQVVRRVHTAEDGPDRLEWTLEPPPPYWSLLYSTVSPGLPHVSGLGRRVRPSVPKARSSYRGGRQV